MTKERASIDKLTPGRYILATSAALTPKNKSALAAIIGPALLGPGDILGLDDLNALLCKYPDIERAHQRLWTTSSTVFEAIVTEIVDQALGKVLSAPSVLSHWLQAPGVVTQHSRRAVQAKVASAYSRFVGRRRNSAFAIRRDHHLSTSPDRALRASEVPFPVSALCA
ncbi:hypothetical protein AGR8A_pAt20034 [Agrobacterium fabrum str. J-07]|nr:hypothetical protein AGR8A_pAt20034 [Agrobacterium fabrum str. J-07]SES12992.1 hypothetical protein SAMN03159504_04749 [Agrobacterium fabrum]